MFCGNCGKEIDDEAIMCVHCKTAINNNYGNEQKNSNNKIMPIVVGCIIGFVALFTLLLVVIFTYEDEAVTIVKNGSFANVPEATVDDFLNTVFSSSGDWEAFELEDGYSYVNAFYYDNENNEWAFQFKVNEQTEAFELESMELNEEPENVFSAFLILSAAYANNKLQKELEEEREEMEEATSQRANSNKQKEESTEESWASYISSQPKNDVIPMANYPKGLLDVVGLTLLKPDKFQSSFYVDENSRKADINAWGGGWSGKGSYYVPELYPLGWSTDDKYFAHLIIEVDDKNFIIKSKLYIQNMVNDQIVKTKEYSEQNINDCWATHENDILRELSVYDITLNKSMKLYPANYENNGVEIKIYTDVQWDEEHPYIDSDKVVVYKYESGYGKRKTVSSWREKVDNSRFDAGVAGVFPSPTQKRIAIVKVNAERLNDEEFLKIQLIGSHLKVGFR